LADFAKFIFRRSAGQKAGGVSGSSKQWPGSLT